MTFWRFIDISEYTLVSGEYDYRLILASWLIASLATFCGLTIRDLVEQQQRFKTRLLWIFFGALALGVGCWAMHLLGMLAVKLPGGQSFDPLTAGLSLLVMMAGVAVALYLMTSKQITFQRLHCSGIALALSMSGMHFIGMEGVVYNGLGLAYNLGLFVVALVAAYTLGFCLVLVRYISEARSLLTKLSGCGLMGLVAETMHFTSMAPAIHYVTGSNSSFSTPSISVNALAIVVFFGALVVIGFVIMLGLLEQRSINESANQAEMATSLPACLIRVDQNLQLTFSNHFAQTLFGYTEEEMLGIYISQLVPAWSGSILNSVSCEQTLRAVARKKQGAEFEMQARVAPGASQNERQLLIVMENVTEYREQDRYLHRLVAALEQASDGIFITSADNENIFLNQAMLTFLRGSTEKLSLSKIMHTNPDISQCLEEGLSWYGQVEINNRDQSVTHVDISVSPIMDADKLFEYLVICRNITALKNNEDELLVARDKAEHATQAKSDFLAMVSHEVRTPMNGLLGLSAMLADTELDSDQKTTLRLIQQSGENLLTIINDILDFSKVEAGKMTIADAPMSLQDLLRDVVELFSLRAKEKELVIELNFEDEMPPRVYGDAGRIKQILVNLIGNAYKFTESGQVTVNVARRHSFVPNLALFRISVIDTGIGMSEAVLERIFEAFTQADAATNRRFGGTGLGLPISKQLVELMGGKIGASSVVAQGSVVWFELPLALARDWAKQEEKSQVIVDNFDGISILLVDDNPVNRKVASHMLKKFGCEVEMAVDGNDAIGKSRLGKYDIILMDCSMPDIDGFEATRRIRVEDSNPNKNSPIIALTARAMQGDREVCLAAGMNDYVTKPIRTVQLTTVLNQWARLRGLDDAKRTANLAN
ncbi:MAG: response regulator [Pseudomonadales bacterium]|nr:response regulator [Pseudomonadales bacterium]